MPVYRIIQTLRKAGGGREGSQLCYEPLRKLGEWEGGFSNVVT